MCLKEDPAVRAGLQTERMREGGRYRWMDRSCPLPLSLLLSPRLLPLFSLWRWASAWASSINCSPWVLQPLPGLPGLLLLLLFLSFLFVATSSLSLSSSCTSTCSSSIAPQVNNISFRFMPCHLAIMRPCHSPVYFHKHCVQKLNLIFICF